MNLYDLLVTGSCNNIIFKELILLDYEIYKYNCNLINFNFQFLNNLNSKLSHPMLKCNFKFTYSIHNIQHTVYFQTYNTFTSSDKNSINVFKNQWFNIYDFIIDQNNSFSKKMDMKSIDYINLNKITKNFSNLLINNYVKIPLQDMLIKGNQCKYSQIIYFDKLNIRINPLKWIQNMFKLS